MNMCVSYAHYYCYCHSLFFLSQESERGEGEQQEFFFLNERDERLGNSHDIMTLVVQVKCTAASVRRYIVTPQNLRSYGRCIRRFVSTRISCCYVDVVTPKSSHTNYYFILAWQEVLAHFMRGIWVNERKEEKKASHGWSRPNEQKKRRKITQNNDIERSAQTRLDSRSAFWSVFSIWFVAAIERQ